ncbi:MAG TPA: Gfo/Idh/MocA family oxidoreductase [Rariglobus sp.]|jgi:predicted dehydrogenase|nr:Gfo/Idh/MocA family oxidoreductase [Rariglobus sp.]
MTKPLRWGILATGKIAGVFAGGVAGSRSGRLVAVGSRSPESARRFAAEHGIVPAHAHGSYAALLADPEVDAVYVSTPHPQHEEWAVKAAAAGKHILCEKPLTLDLAAARRVIGAARQHGVLLMEAFMYRCHPQTVRVIELIRSGVLGRVGLVQAAFGFNAPFDAGGRIWGNALGGGGILDVGGYPVSWARLVAGAVDGAPFLEPVKIAGTGVLHPQTGVDAYAAATLTFANGVIAQVSCGVGLQQDNVVRIYGTAGWLLVPSPFVVARDLSPSKIFLHRAGVAKPEEIVITPDRLLYAYEADAFAGALAAGLRDVPAMSTADTLGNMAVLDDWLRQTGVIYALAPT